MTSSNDRWNAGGTDAAVRATRWAPSELHIETASAGTTGDLSTPTPAVDPVEQATTAAFERGFQQGQRQEAEKVAPALATLEAAVEELRASQPAWIDNIEKNVLTLAVAVARQIVGQELATNPDAILHLVSRALTRFPVELPLTIRLHPSDLSRISAAALESTGSDLAAGRDVRWRADVHIDEGSCVVEGPERMVDGRVDKALLRIYQRLVTDDEGLVTYD